MSKQSRLLDFFVSLQDAEALKQFNADPDAAMGAAGLSDAEKALVRRRNAAEIRSALGADSTVLSMYFGDPEQPA